MLANKIACPEILFFANIFNRDEKNSDFCGFCPCIHGLCPCGCARRQLYDTSKIKHCPGPARNHNRKNTYHAHICFDAAQHDINIARRISTAHNSNHIGPVGHGI